MAYKDIMMIAFSYLLGCINTGYYYVKFAYGEDVREKGTKVTGAMNVSRIAGRKGFLITFLGDAMKGAVVVLLSRLLKLGDLSLMLCILMVIAGHIFPFQLKFQGGKGISTAFGAFLAFHPVIILYLVLLCVVLLPLIKQYTMTSLLALLLLPVILLLRSYSWQAIGFFLLYAVIINTACRGNWKNYFENKQYSSKLKIGK
jgi:Predicted membrane protein